MKFVALVICPFAPISSEPPERTQLHRNLVCVCVCFAPRVAAAFRERHNRAAG